MNNFGFCLFFPSFASGKEIVYKIVYRHEEPVNKATI